MDFGYNRTGLTLLAVFIVLSITLSLWWLAGLAGLWLYAAITG